MSYTLDIKHVFLSFAQYLFAEHPEYPWLLDINRTSIFIADKYAISNPIIETTPSIILSRGPFRWGNVSIGQIKTQSLDKSHIDYTDLIDGSITYNVIAKQGILAERLADHLFKNLAAFKFDFKKRGIHALVDISLGDERVLKTGSEIELVTVPINVRFQSQKALGFVQDAYTLSLSTTCLVGAGNPYLGAGLLDDGDITTGLYSQYKDYYVSSGNEIVFYFAPSGVSINATYTHAITLAEVIEDLSSQVNAINRIFTLSSPAYGVYPIYSGYEHTQTLIQ